MAGSKVAAGTISLLLLATPVGWVAVLATIAAVGVGAATVTNKIVKSFDDQAYDWIMTKIASLY